MKYKLKHGARWLKNPFHLGFALLLAVILGIGATMAFFTDREAAVNHFQTGKIELELNETVSGLTKTKIGVTSRGTSKCYVRVRVDIPTVTYRLTKQDTRAEGQALLYDTQGREIKASEWAVQNQLPAVVVQGNTVREGSEWIKKEDGFWYLAVTLVPGESVRFLNEITFPGLWDEPTGKVVQPLPDGLTLDMLTIPIAAEAVQAEGLPVGELTGADAALQAFRVVDGLS